MSRPATARLKKYLSHGMPEPLISLEQLDVPWHFDCVLRPRSHATSSKKPAHSVAAKLQSGGLPSGSPASAPIRDHSHAATSPPVSSPLDHRKQAALQRVFNTFDENGDGTVSIQEISRILENLGLQNTNESSLASLVTKSGGHVDEQEFLALYESICCSDTSATSSSPQTDVDEDLLAAFHVFDKDGNGFISPAELQTVLCSLGFPQGRQLEACVDMIARVDENGDGLVDFSEFKKLFHADNSFILISAY